MQKLDRRATLDERGGAERVRSTTTEERLPGAEVPPGQLTPPHSTAQIDALSAGSLSGGELWKRLCELLPNLPEIRRRRLAGLPLNDCPRCGKPSMWGIVCCEVGG